MWTTIHVAIGKDLAYEIGEQLKEVGFIVKIKFLTMEGEIELYEILAPEFEASEIQEAMIEMGIL